MNDRIKFVLRRLERQENIAQKLEATFIITEQRRGTRGETVAVSEVSIKLDPDESATVDAVAQRAFERLVRTVYGSAPPESAQDERAVEAPASHGGRYALFVGGYRPSDYGGWSNYAGRYVDLHEAEHEAERRILPGTSRWAHIVDLQDMYVVRYWTSEKGWRDA